MSNAASPTRSESGRRSAADLSSLRPVDTGLRVFKPDRQKEPATTAVHVEPPPPRPPSPWGAYGSVSSRLRLTGQPTAVIVGRHFTVAQLSKWNLDALAEDCVLATSELITNAITATGRSDVPLREESVASIVLRLRFTPVRLFCEVWDISLDPPLPAEPGELDDTAETGRGLLLVASLCADWGYYYPSQDPGKIVWAAFDIDPHGPRT